MKKIIVLMLIILLASGCTNSQKTVKNSKVEQTNYNCPSCKEECRKQCDEEIAKAQEPYKHEIDLAEEKCLKGKYRTNDMRNCAYDAMDAWFLKINKDLKTLKDVLPAEKYEKIAKSQKEWEEYQKAEFEANNEVFMNKLGHIYYVISVGHKTELVKERALLLESYIQTAKEP